MIGEQGLRTLLDRLPDAVVAVDPELSLLYANATAHRVFRPAALRLGEPLPTGPLDFDLTGFAHALFRRQTGNVEHVARTDDFIFRVIGIPSPDGEFAALVLEDVTIRGDRERARSEFVANAAHELLTPLTGIVSAAHVLESGAKEVPEMRDRFLNHISRECHRLTRIARGLLTLARSQSGEEPPRPESVELRELLDHVVDAAAEPAAMSVSCPTGVTVWVDADLAETALSNVIGNAVRHSPDGRVEVSVDAGTDEVGVVVANTARRMSPAEVARLRRRFATGDGRDGEGFGLGVSIATQAVEALNGSLTFEAANGETRVRVTFPSGSR